MTTLRVCRRPGCGQLTDHGLCPTHRRADDQTRGSRSQRGYGAAHRRQRRQWAPKVAAGTVCCARCGQPITPGQPWDLDHSDDRTGWLGPSHATCNRATATPGG